MRDYRPPFLTEADDVLSGSVFLAGGGHYKSMLNYRDRIGHTTPDDGYFLSSNELVLPTVTTPTSHNESISRVTSKLSTSNAAIGRAGVAPKASNSYNASTVR